MGLASSWKEGIEKANAKREAMAAGIVTPKRLKVKKERFAGITVEGDTISHKDGSGPIVGATATVDSAGEIDKRITATRLMLAGPFALAMRKKKDHRELYLTVAGSGFGFVVEVDPKDGLEARRFAARINALASSA
jgi:hypothetical protein